MATFPPKPTKTTLPFPLKPVSAESELKRWTVTLIAALWIPCAALALVQGRESLRWFMGDFAAQSRFLVVIPILILARPALARRLSDIAQHFISAKLVDHAGRVKMEAWAKWLRQDGESLRVKSFLVFISFVIALSAVDSVQRSHTLLPWAYRSAQSGRLSAAGVWYLLVVMPCVEFLLFRWIWRQVLWLIFLAKVSRLRLRVIPSHPDRTAGLSFLEHCLRKCFPFCFAVGTLFAGGVANRIAYEGASVASFRYVAFVPVAIIIVICVTPLCVFFNPLLVAKHKGVFAYGGLATSMGRRFEERWMPRSRSLSQDALEAPDFSATTDLNSITANVHEMRFVPFKSASVLRLAGWTLAPFVPVAVAAVPFDVLADRVLKLVL